MYVLPVALNSPINALRRDDLPAPLGPTIPMISPFIGNENVISLRMCFSQNKFK